MPTITELYQPVKAYIQMAEDCLKKSILDVSQKQTLYLQAKQAYDAAIELLNNLETRETVTHKLLTTQCYIISAYIVLTEDRNLAISYFQKAKAQFEAVLNSSCTLEDPTLSMTNIKTEFIKCAVQIAVICESYVDSTQHKHLYPAQTAYYYEQVADLLSKLPSLSDENKALKERCQLKASLFYYMIGMQQTSIEFLGNVLLSRYNQFKKLPRYEELFSTDYLIECYRQAVNKFKPIIQSQSANLVSPILSRSPLFTSQIAVDTTQTNTHSEQRTVQPKGPRTI